MPLYTDSIFTSGLARRRAIWKRLRSLGSSSASSTLMYFLSVIVQVFQNQNYNIMHAIDSYFRSAREVRRRTPCYLSCLSCLFPLFYRGLQAMVTFQGTNFH